MTPQEFVNKWAGTTLGEMQSYQLHFTDVCKLVGHSLPGSSGYTENGEYFHFQRHVRKRHGESGFADVYFENHFAIEYKTPHKYKNLDKAFEQLQRYQRQLKNPPLLIVTDIENWRIHTNFTNTIPKVYTFSNSDITARPEIMQWLRDIFHNPQVFNPERNTHMVTRESADALKAVADDMRITYNVRPERAARFLTRIIFSLFAEDIGLLPSVTKGKGLFSFIVEQNLKHSQNLRSDIEALFEQMEDGGRLHSLDIKWFNGALFKDIQIESLSLHAIASLGSACRQDWRYVEPAIFGTLFERCLDPAKRAQLGAHYTSPQDILLIVEPVLMQPLRREWAATQAEAHSLRERYQQATSVRKKEAIKEQLIELRDNMLDRLRSTTVLDPACGSGNFLYIALQQMMDLELDIISDPLWDGFDRAELRVSPAQLYGIEKDEIAHALASIVVWIGYIKWREDHGFRYDEKPLLQDLSDNIVCKDAILPSSQDPHPPAPSPKMREGELEKRNREEYGDSQMKQNAERYTKPATNDESPLPRPGGGGLGEGVNWPAVDVIVGNPPFLGNKKMQHELGGYYYWMLQEHYDGRIPGGVDLVCYWFEVARQHIQAGKAKRAGLLATNSIRGGLNRQVLSRIKESGDIFMAWSDRPWILDGAAVRVSMVGFDNGQEDDKRLDGLPVQSIFSNLTADIDITGAKVLTENARISFQGVIKRGAFDIDEKTAQEMIAADPKNSEVLKPIYNGIDITRRPRNMWIIDFGVNTPIEVARQYKLPFAYVEKFVKPQRAKVRQEKSRLNWWLYESAGPKMRAHLKGLDRYICTPRVAKHRIFVWLEGNILPDTRVNVFSRSDDYFFGVLNSSIHELWSLRLASWHGVGNDPTYNNTTCFETFPFPWPPGSEDESHPAHTAISAAAAQLHAERDAWLNPLNPHPPAPSPQNEGGGENPREMEYIARIGTPHAGCSA